MITEPFSVVCGGRLVNIPTIDEICFALKTRYETQEIQNKSLLEENEKLKSEHYAEIELKEMRRELNRMKADYDNGFPITNEELQAIKKWCMKHDADVHDATTPSERARLGGVSGGRFKYIFTPTGLGTVGVIQCACGDAFCFRDLD